jgi:hypothetical protein
MQARDQNKEKDALNKSRAMQSRHMKKKKKKKKTSCLELSWLADCAPGSHACIE